MARCCASAWTSAIRRLKCRTRPGNPDGVGVKLAEALAAHLGRPLKIVPMEFSGLIPALKTGNIDLILSSMTATDERRKSIDFSDPYAFTGLALLVRKDSEIQSIEDLKKPGRTITAKDRHHRRDVGDQESAQCQARGFRETRPPASWKSPRAGPTPSSTTNSASIKYSGENKETTRGLLKPFVEESWALGIAKGNDALRGQVNAFLDEFRKQDGFGKLGDRYLQEEKKFLEAAGVPFILR